jgi:gentisate 1,2-dioxygenase
MHPAVNREISAERRDYYERLGASHMAPLWEVLATLSPQQPMPLDAPAFWRYADLREQVMEAGRLITAEEAERRVLILENPALPGQSCVTHSLYAGFQLILPGEVARVHRHSQSALRLLLEGEGAYTAVDGERTTMRRGDFIVTPAWTWHDHGNPGKDPVVWLDGLDIPIVRYLGAGFMEKQEQVAQQMLMPEGDALARFGNNMVPHDYVPHPTDPARMFVYPYDLARDALRRISHGEPDKHHGFKMRYVNPATGAAPMPTIGTFLQLLPTGFETRPYRCTDSTVHVCLEGEGHVQVGERAWRIQPNDIFVVPSWHPLQVTCSRELVVFGFSDRPIQTALGLWRELRT